MRWVLVSLAVACACLACAGSSQCSTCGRGSKAPAEEPAAPPENERGVIDGPVDETAFVYDIAPPARSDPAPELDGVPALPAALVERLAPYLQTRRGRL